MTTFSCDPSKYTMHRPQYPESLFRYLYKITDDSSIVLECGAGSGQASVGLANNFFEVVALDVSFELLSQASSRPNILYIHSDAKQLPIQTSSVDLLCIAQALHWFDLDKFYDEAKRVVKPGGIIAAWCYNKSTIDVHIDKIIDRVHEEISDKNIKSKQRQYVYENYQTIPFPFSKLVAPSFSMSVNWSLYQLLGYIKTWPGVIEYQKKYNVDLVSEISEELLLHWGDPENIKLINWLIHLLLGRIEK